MAIKSSISQQIWDMKYRFKADDGTPVDKTMQDTFKRIAVALADPEKDQDHWREVFFEGNERFQISAGGSNLSRRWNQEGCDTFQLFCHGGNPG